MKESGRSGFGVRNNKWVVTGVQRVGFDGLVPAPITTRACKKEGPGLRVSGSHAAEPLLGQ